MKYLSLIFDDGPSQMMCNIADRIKEYGWSAGFAIIGRRINEDSLPLLKYVIENGFQIVSHGQQHVHTENLSSRAEILEELSLPIKTVKAELNYEITMARLPYLTENAEVLRVAKELNLPLLGYGLNGGDDWDPEAKTDKIVKAVLGSVSDGAIGCLHVLEPTYKALGEIFPELKNRDFCLVTPKELFEKKGITPPLGIQIHNVNDFLK